MKKFTLGEIAESCGGKFVGNESDKNIALAERVTDIFEGSIPLYYYFTESGKYELQPREKFVEVNNTELKELKRILGEDNVAFVK